MKTNIKAFGKLLKDLGFLFMLYLIFYTLVPEHTIKQTIAVLSICGMISFGIFTEYMETK